MQNIDNLKALTRRLRIHILESTTKAGSGHLTSSLSAVELMTVLMFGGYFRSFIDNPKHPNNDRLIFSKGHASPLLYSLWAVAGAFPAEELLTLREFGSRLEGHPTMAFPYTEAPTGSLGQGLSVGLGMALNAQYLDKLPYKTFVLLGDSELAEGSNWEAMAIAAYYKLRNLIGIVDVNRLGQRGETMQGHDVENLRLKVEAFGWATSVIDGHDLHQIDEAYKKAQQATKPYMIIAKTLKGKGFTMVEDKDGWHGKAVSKEESMLIKKEFGEVDMTVIGKLVQPEQLTPHTDMVSRTIEMDDSYSAPLSTRKAYGHALVEMFPAHPEMVVLDAETSNSTYADAFMKTHPDRSFEMFIAEQNMVGVALGLSLRGKMPFISTFAAFLSRAFDQLRVAQYAGAHINVAGSHCGVSIGEDGMTQMGLEDIAMFRSFLNSTVLYPADHVAAEKLTNEMAHTSGITYIRTTRGNTETLYDPKDTFPIGGSKVLRHSTNDKVTIVAAGITLYEALQAYEDLLGEDIIVRIIDLYSIKPLDTETLHKAAKETGAIITVEDHYEAGGMGEAVATALSGTGTPVHTLAVRKMPRSGKPNELLEYEDISATAIITKVKEIVHGRKTFH